jgi:hypothetical protein
MANSFRAREDEEGMTNSVSQGGVHIRAPAHPGARKARQHPSTLEMYPNTAGNQRTAQRLAGRRQAGIANQLTAPNSNGENPLNV